MAATEVWIGKNEATGEITLKPKADDQRRRNIAELFGLIKENSRAHDFIPARKAGELSNPFDEPARRAS